MRSLFFGKTYVSIRADRQRDEDATSRPLRRPASASRHVRRAAVLDQLVAATITTATTDMTTRRESAESAKPDKATNGTYGDPTATTRSMTFDSGRARTASVTTEKSRATTASAVRRTRSLPDIEKACPPCTQPTVHGRLSVDER